MNTMGIGVGDYDRDGRLDLALSNIGGNRLLHNNGNGTFTDTSSQTGMSVPQQETGRLSVTWGMLFGDFNLDGWEDLYAAAGDLSVEGSTSDPVTQENQTLVHVARQLVPRPVCGQRRRRSRSFARRVRG